MIYLPRNVIMNLLQNKFDQTEQKYQPENGIPTFGRNAPFWIPLGKLKEK